MFLAHSFRLCDPWQCEPTADGGLRWSRVFHRPTGLEPDDQLVLVLIGAPTTAQVTINGQTFPPIPDSTELAEVILQPPAPFQYDLTRILADDNRIEILVPSPA
ncbi:MAG: hypothetical protein H0T51_01055, partial [Pirellulales bacterium]|nr:hypothetical protein [Pirellulales bacterium]